MSDQYKEAQQPKTATQHLKELFEKENFKKNSVLTGSIVNSSTNAIHISSLYKEKSFSDLQIDMKILDEILKRDEIKSVVTYNPQEGTLTPTWQRLRNNLYFTNVDKEDKAEITKHIEDTIKSTATDYKIDPQSSNETIKITITTPGKEEDLTKQLFDKLFMKTFKIGDKQVSLNCAIEEEQFAAPFVQNFYPQQSNNANFPMFDPRFQQNYINQFYQHQQQFLMKQQLDQMKHNQNRLKGNRNMNKVQQNGNQSNNKNGFQTNTQAKTGGNALHQPAQQHSQNKGMKGQIKGAKFNKFSNKGMGGKSQRVFSANEQDFPSLQ